MNEHNQQDSQFSIHQNVRKRRRFGFTLIEIIVSFAILTSLMASAVGLVTLAQRSQERAKDSRTFRREVSRFAKTFRQDAQATNLRLMLKSANELILHRPNENLSYQIGSHSQITRTKTSGDKAGKRIDRFVFGTEVDIQLSQPDANEPVRWTLTDRRFPAQPITVMAGWRGSDS